MPIDYAGSDDYVENVRIKATSDAARGGLDEPANYGLQDLADRTAYLQARRLEDYRQAIENASGGLATVKEDDSGTWHVMARIPAFRTRDFDADLEYDVGTPFHPAFRLDDSTTIPEFLVSLCVVSKPSGPVISDAGNEPYQVDHDNARSTCAALGDGFHLLTIHEYAALSIWAFNLVTNLRGNTEDNVLADQEYGAKTLPTEDLILTGTGPLTWRHNGREFGVADLVGQLDECINLIRSVDCKLYFPFYNEFWSDPADWPDQGIYFSKSAGGDLVIDGAQLIDNNQYSQDFDAIEYGANFTPGSLPDALVDPRLPELLLNRTWYTDGAPPTPHTSTFLDSRIGKITFKLESGTRYFVRGGNFSDGDDAGLPTLRPVAGDDATGFQFRIAWIDPTLIPTP